MTLDIDTETDLSIEVMTPYEDLDDGKNHYAHIINPPTNIHLWIKGMTTLEIIEIARMTNQKIVALCGYKWVPKRTPNKYPVCKSCLDIAGQLMRANNE